MFTEYVRKAMQAATYEILEDGTFYGEIPLCPGVWATAETLEECRNTLQEVLEEWLILKLQDGDPIPVIMGIDLRVREPA